MTDTFDVTGILLERVLAAVEGLHAALLGMPAPRIDVPPVDLSEIVMAVSGLRPSASAEEIASAIARKITPPANDTSALAGVIGELGAKLEQLDFRMKGSMPAFGASGPSNISDNPDRQLGHVTIDGFTIPGASTAGLASEATLQNVREGVTTFETRLDYDTRTDGLPVYVGKATNGTATSAATWVIQKLTYDASNRLTRAQVLTGVYNNRATLAW